MATWKSFEDIDVWQLAREFNKDIYRIIRYKGLSTDYRLRDQINGSAGSVMDNIAEGFERDGNLEFRQFLSIAKGSAGESRSQLYRVFDSEYISEEKLNKLVIEYKTLSRRISSFISYLNKKDYKGTKFR